VLWFLGFNIAPKCLPSLIPSQTVVWTGVVIDSVMMEFRMEPKRIGKIQAACSKALEFTLQGKPLMLRQWAQVLGNCRSVMFSVLPALLWTQGIKRLVNSNITGKEKSVWDRLIPVKLVLPEVLANLRIWLSPQLAAHNGRPIRPPPATVLTDSDASGFGGGMVMTSPHSAECRVHFDKDLYSKHINLKELVMHLKGLQGLDLQMPGLAFSNLFQNRTDNSVSLSSRAAAFSNFLFSPKVYGRGCWPTTRQFMLSSFQAWRTSSPTQPPDIGFCAWTSSFASTCFSIFTTHGART
jgi:hypothetical protein